jgi:peptide/nickel transport system substrate-binding protein
MYLDHPVPYFLQILCMPFCYVIPKEIAEFYGEDFGRHPVGTGPFKFQVWDEGNKMIFVKHENYWKKDQKGRAMPYLDGVEISFISDVSQSFKAYQLGYFDFVSRLNESVLDEVLYPDGTVKKEISDKYTIFKGEYLATDYLGFQLDKTTEVYKNDQQSPMLNADFRKALNYSVDRKRIVTLLRNGLGIVGESGVIPPAMPYFDAKNVKGFSFDPKKAQEYLTKSGIDPKKVKGLKLTLATQNQALAEFLTKTWKEVLGVEIAIDLNEGKVCIDLADNGKVNFYKMGWLADYPDGENYLTLFFGKNFTPEGPNRSHYKNATFDQLYQKSITVNDPTERGRIYEQMDALMMEESPIIVLYYGQILALINKNIKNFYLDPMNLLILEKVEKK